MNKLECIDDSGRPETIPLSRWVTKSKVYTELKRYNGMNGVEIVELEEIDLKPFIPYKGFASSRFKILEDDGSDELVEELIRELELELK